jgi:hypothetical protein
MQRPACDARTVLRDLKGLNLYVTRLIVHDSLPEHLKQWLSGDGVAWSFLGTRMRQTWLSSALGGTDGLSAMRPAA